MSGSRSSHSGVTHEQIRSAKSRSWSHGSSRASICVTLPRAHVDKELQRKSPVNVQSISPERHSHLTGSGEDDRIHSSHSSGNVPPQVTPTRRRLSDREVERILSARIVERAWLSYRDRQMFKLLKHAICAAEHSLSHEILRKVSPVEANFLKDKCMQPKVRFRFGGVEYPPLIYFKIYTCTSNGIGVRYVSGKKMIQPASEAARDACDLMGNRKFYDQMIQDTVHHQTHKVTDEVDITTLKDYMQYLSVLDETPAVMGGKENSWRKLTLEVLPRQTIFYDVVDFMYSKRMSDHLREELPILLARPMTQELRRRHIQIISQLRPCTPSVPVNTAKTKSSLSTSRRSQQAKARASKMRRMYTAQKEALDQTALGGLEERGEQGLGHPMIQSQEFNSMDQDGGGDDDWEEEAEKLYEWTQELSFDESLATPRLHTATLPAAAAAPLGAV